MLIDPSDKALARFADKCRFDPETGCLIWTGAKTHSNAHENRTGVFKYQGKRWYARRWAAHFIVGEDIDHDREVFTTCGEPLCVRHLRVDYPIINTRQHWLLVTLGYGDDEPEDHKRERLTRERAAARAAIPDEERGVPGWFRPFTQDVLPCRLAAPGDGCRVDHRRDAIGLEPGA